jgi:hypothetical protein
MNRQMTQQQRKSYPFNRSPEEAPTATSFLKFTAAMGMVHDPNLIDASRLPGHDHDSNCVPTRQQALEQPGGPVNQIAAIHQPD